MITPLSPDCQEGKHANCVGLAFNPENPDEVVDCLCDYCLTSKLNW